MSNLVDMNRLQFQKIFDVHQQKGTLSYTDALKICSSLKIFPDLLTSQEIRKIFLTLSYSDNGLERMTFLQFESFLKICSKQAFRHAKSQKSDDYESLINFIKETSARRYGINLEACKGRSLSKTLKSSRASRGTVSTPKTKVQNSFFKPPSEKEFGSKKNMKGISPNKVAVPRVKGLVNLLSPGIKNLKNRIEQTKSYALTERRDEHHSGCSTSPSPCKPNIISKINKLFGDFQNSCRKVDTEKFLTQKKIKKIFAIDDKRKEKYLMTKLAFGIWKLSV